MEVCEAPTDLFFKKSMHYRKKHASQTATFSTTPSLSIITIFRRGFPIAHHIEQSRALLYMAHPGMEPLWAAECILILTHQEEIFRAEAAEHNLSYLPEGLQQGEEVERRVN